MPADKDVPNGVTSIVFIPLKFNAPPTTIKSFPAAFGSGARSKWLVVPPFRVRPLLKVKVPATPPVPGEIRQFAAATLPVTMPEPDKL